MKKGSIFTLERLVSLVLAVMGIIAILLILVGILNWTLKGQKTKEDRNFERILNAMDAILKNFETKTQHGTISVPIDVKHLSILFYSNTDSELPKKCKKQACLCMYSIVENQMKETCRNYDFKSEYKTPCGKTICAPKSILVDSATIGDAIKIGIECTDQGTEFVIAKTKTWKHKYKYPY